MWSAYFQYILQTEEYGFGEHSASAFKIGINDLSIWGVLFMVRYLKWNNKQINAKRLKSSARALVFTLYESEVRIILPEQGAAISTKRSKVLGNRKGFHQL